MNRYTYLMTSATIFSLVAAFHLIRVFMDWPLQLGAWIIPDWASLLAALVAGTLSYQGCRLKRKK